MARNRQRREGWYTSAMRKADETEIEWLRQRWPDPARLSDGECWRVWRILGEAPVVPRGEPNERDWLTVAFYQVLLAWVHHDGRYQDWKQMYVERPTQRVRRAPNGDAVPADSWRRRGLR